MYSEQPIEIHPAPGVVVNGRVDLIKRLDTEETSIVDFKSTERAQREELTRDQLHLYALGCYCRVARGILTPGLPQIRT